MFNTDLLSIGNTFWLGMANHLWQSTLFAIAAWLITIFLKKNRARIQYWIWFAVSIKFLIPFSLKDYISIAATAMQHFSWVFPIIPAVKNCNSEIKVTLLPGHKGNIKLEK